MALTLLEASKLNPAETVRNAVIEMWARSSDIMRVMPFVDIVGESLVYRQEGQLPGVAFRGINEAYPESTGIVNPQTERLRIAGGDLDVDVALIRTHGIGVRASHEEMKVKSLGLAMTRTVIKGDSIADIREFDGLQNRITGSQLIAAKASSPTNGGDPLSLNKLDEAIDAVDMPTHILMSKAMRRRLTAAARDIDVGGHIQYSVDEFGNRVTLYNDLPIVIVDVDNVGARILDFDEVGPGGANATATSIYVVSFGESMLTGLQNGVMDVRDLGEISAKPVYRTRVEWNVGMAALHGRCASRLWGISDAPVIA